MSNCSFKDPGISQPALHQYLWEHSNRHHEVQVNRVEMGELLGVTRFTVMRHLREMCSQGRLSKLKRTSERNVGTYQVNDPADFPNDRANPRRYPSAITAVPAPNPAVAERRQLKWG